MEKRLIKNIAFALLIATTTLLGGNITPANAQTMDNEVRLENKVENQMQTIHVKNVMVLMLNGRLCVDYNFIETMDKGYN
ncbi:hypothetical protein [Clostridium taeniosporum]|uniref:Uncharacterized protein n=1 Tax=Clostridium taeniosporum TaxID=394958 RepID=A0A1D7XNT3_9CLOT|nr:hypothetical protein [Clostridium taeniosporum]AOR25001.1 hypothetical protein BGI42_14740 [Clostridium taeniosporum]